MRLFSTKMVGNLLGFGCVAAVGALAASTASAAAIYGIDDQNNLFSFDSAAPQTVLTAHFISGLNPNEHLVGIDFQPVMTNPLLYGIGSSGQLYTLNQATGAATPVGPGFGLLSGNSYGMDVDPVSGNIRLVSDTDVNTVINAASGLAETPPHTALHYAGNTPNPNVVGTGYSFNQPTSGLSTLYGIDSDTDSLVRIGSPGGTADSPNNGNLTTIGALGVNTSNFVGFDVSANNIGVAALEPLTSGVSHLYGVDLNTGQAVDQGVILGGIRVVDLTITPGDTSFVLPEPGSLLVFGAMTLGLGLRRRRA